MQDGNIILATPDEAASCADSFLIRSLACSPR